MKLLLSKKIRCGNTYFARYLIAARPELDPRPSFRPKPGKNRTPGRSTGQQRTKNITWMEKRLERRLEEWRRELSAARNRIWNRSITKKKILSLSVLEQDPR